MDIYLVAVRRQRIRKIHKCEIMNRDMLVAALEDVARKELVDGPRIVMDKDSPVGIKLVGRNGESVIVE